MARVGAHRPDTKRQLSKAANRVRVIDAARAIFRAHGYEAATIRDIASAVGVSTGLIFNSFPDKAALFEAAMGERLDIAGFLEKIVDAARLASVDPERGQALMELATEARRLRGHLVGNA